MRRWLGWTGMLALALALAACSSQRPAPVVDRSGTPRPERQAGRDSDSRSPRWCLHGAAWRYPVQHRAGVGIDVRELARWNNISDASCYRWSGAARCAPAGAATVTPVAPMVRQKCAPCTSRFGVSATGPSYAGARPTTVPPRPTARRPASPRRLKLVQFQWPAPGKVIETSTNHETRASTSRQ